MPALKHTEATSGRRELGEELRHLRRQHNYSGNDVALKLGWSPSRISRLENGLTGITNAMLATLLAFYRVSEDAFVRLFELNRVALNHNRVRPHRELLLDEVRLASLHDASATCVTEYAPLAIPTLLQTAEYAQAHLHATQLMSDEDIARRLSALERRQTIFTRSTAKFRFFLSEPVLRTPVGDQLIMGKQLRRLFTITAQHDCTIRVLPASAGPSGMLGGPFRLLEYAESRDVAHTHTQTAHIFQEDPADVDAYRAIVGQLHQRALDPDQSIQVINDLAITYTGIIQPLASSNINGATVATAGQQHD